MDFKINPNTHYIKVLRVIDACTSPLHVQAAERCIELYDIRGDEYVKFFDKSSIGPIVFHTGQYDHVMAVWILRKNLSNKEL